MIQRLTWQPRLSEAKITEDFLTYVAVATGEAFKDHERYRVAFPRTVFADRIAKWALERSQKEIITSIVLDFSITSLMVDVSYHLVEPISLEKALVTSFPDDFADVLCDTLQDQETTEETGTSPGNPIKQMFAMMDLARSRQKTITEAFNAVLELQTKWGEIVSETAEDGSPLPEKELQKARSDHRKGVRNASIEAASKAWGVLSLLPLNELGQPGEQVKFVLDTAFTCYAGVNQAKALVDKWRLVMDKGALSKLRQREKTLKHTIRSIGDLTEGGTLNKLWTQWSWNKWALNELRTKPIPEKNVLELLEISEDKEKLGALVSEGLPNAQLPKLKYGSLIEIGTAGLDLTLQAYQAYEAWSTWRNTADALKLQEERLVATTWGLANSWFSKSTGVVAPEWDKCVNVMSQIRLLETLRVNYRKESIELLKQQVMFVLKLLEFVPVLGEIAWVINLTIDTVKLGEELLASGLDVVDRYVLKEKLKAWKAERANRVGIRKRVRAVRAGMRAQRKNWSGTTGPQDDPVFQAYVLEEALLGLMYLIDRCGARVNSAAFARKVKQYRIEEYVKAWFGPHPRAYYTVWSSWLESVPGANLGEYWLYCVGNKEGRDDEELFWRREEEPFVGELREAYVWIENLFMFETRLAIGVPLVPVTYQNWFPIHHVESKDIYSLCRFFGRTMPLLEEWDIVYSKVYLWRDGRWEPVKDDRQNGAESAVTPWPTPLTPVRIVVIFGGGSTLFGLPVSVQLIRTDTWPDTAGPVYKTSVEPLDQAENYEFRREGGKGGETGAGPGDADSSPVGREHGEGLSHAEGDEWFSQIASGSDGAISVQEFASDDGLLPYGDEAEFLPKRVPGEPSGRTIYNYGFVLYPFYVWRKQTLFGVKPTGPVPYQPNQSMKVKFRLKVGPRTFKIGDASHRDGDVFKVYLHGKNEVATPLTLDRGFLWRKSALDGKPQPVLIGNTHIAAICLKCGKNSDWVAFSGHAQVIRKDRFVFDWMQPFEVILLVASVDVNREWANSTDHAFSCNVRVVEVQTDFLGGWHEKAVGPEYACEARSMEMLSSSYKSGTGSTLPRGGRRMPVDIFVGPLKVEELNPYLKQAGILRPKENVVKHVRLGEGSDSKDSVVKLIQPGVGSSTWRLSAIRLKFSYSVCKFGDHLVYEALKPFGKVTERGEEGDPFVYTFYVVAPTDSSYRDCIKSWLQIEFPPLPSVRSIGDDWDHLREGAFVERRELWPLLNIVDSDYLGDAARPPLRRLRG